MIGFYFIGNNSSSSSSGHVVPGSMLNSSSSHVNTNSGRNMVTLSNSVNNSTSSYQNSISLQDRIKDVPQSTVISTVSASSSPFSLSAGSSQQVHVLIIVIHEVLFRLFCYRRVGDVRLTLISVFPFRLLSISC